jgi:hypothetical protein
MVSQSRAQILGQGKGRVSGEDDAAGGLFDPGLERIEPVRRHCIQIG